MIGLKQLAGLAASLIVFAGTAVLDLDGSDGTVALKATPGGGTALVADAPVPVTLAGVEAIEVSSTAAATVTPSLLEGRLGTLRITTSTLAGPVHGTLGGEQVRIPAGSRITITDFVGSLELTDGGLATRLGATGLARELTVAPPQGTPVATESGREPGIPVKRVLINDVPVQGGLREMGMFEEVRFDLVHVNETAGPLSLSIGAGTLPLEAELTVALEDYVGLVALVQLTDDELLLKLDGFANVSVAGETYDPRIDEEHRQGLPGGGPGALNEAPIASFTFRPSGPSAGQSIEFVDRSEDDLFVAKWAWDFGDGTTSRDQHPTHVFSGGGAYDVTLTVTDAQGASDTTTETLLVANSRPQVTITWQPLNPIEGEMTGLTAYVDDTEDDVETVEWRFSDGVVIDGSLNARSFPVKGAYNVSVVATDADGARGWANATINVRNAPPIPSFQVIPEEPMAGQPARLVSTSTDPAGGEVVNTTWRVGGVARPFYGQEATVVFPQDGKVSVELVATDNDGASASKTRLVDVLNPPPIVGISFTPVYPNPGVPASFVAIFEDDDLPSQARWTFSDGSERSGLAVTKAFGVGGTYTVALNVTDADGASGEAVRTIRVNHPPSATIVASSTVVHTGEAVVLSADVTDLDGNATTLSWTVDKAPAGSSTSIERIWDDDGNHTIRLKATDDNGAVDRATLSVLVLNRPPTLDPQVVANHVNQGDTVRLSANANDPDGTIDAVEWWRGGEIVATGQEADVPFPVAGVVHFEVKAIDDDGATTTVPLAVAVNAAPSLSADVSTNRAVAGEPITFDAFATDPEGDAVDLLWDFGDGITSTESTITRAYTLGGTYVARVTATDEHGASVSESFSLVISVPPLETALTRNVQAPQVGDDITFTVSVPSGRSIESIDWDFGDGTPRTTTGPGVRSITHAFGQAKTFQMSAVVHADQGSTKQHGMNLRVTGSVPHAFAFSVLLPDGQCTNMANSSVAFQLTNGETGQTIGLRQGTYLWSQEGLCTVEREFPAGTWAQGDSLSLVATVGAASTMRALDFNQAAEYADHGFVLDHATLAFETFAIHNRTQDGVAGVSTGSGETERSTYEDPLEPVLVSGEVLWAEGTPLRTWELDLVATYRSPVGISQFQEVPEYARWTATTDDDGSFETVVPALLLGAAAGNEVVSDPNDASFVYAPGQYSVVAQAASGTQTSTRMGTFVEDPHGIFATLRERGVEL